MHKKFEFDEALKRAKVTLIEKGKRYKGVAIAHETDTDVTSQKTGLTIANARAHVDMHTRKANACKNEIKKLQKQIDHYNRLRAHHLVTAAQIGIELEEYLKGKADFATNLRKMRAKQTAAKEEN